MKFILLAMTLSVSIPILHQDYKTILVKDRQNSHIDTVQNTIGLDTTRFQFVGSEVVFKSLVIETWYFKLKYSIPRYSIVGVIEQKNYIVDSLYDFPENSVYHYSRMKGHHLLREATGQFIEINGIDTVIN